MRNGLFALLIAGCGPNATFTGDASQTVDAPLAGIREELARLGLPDVAIRTAVRTGDTPQGERARLRRKPPLGVDAMTDLYRRYEAEKRRRGVIDFDDLLWLCVRHRPLRSYITVLFPIANGFIVPQFFEEYDGMPLALAISMAVFVASAWLARLIARQGDNPSISQRNPVP